MVRQCCRGAAAKAASASPSSLSPSNGLVIVRGKHSTGEKPGHLPGGDFAVQIVREADRRGFAPETRLVEAPSQSLPRNLRLAKRREFLRVYEAGRKLFSRYCVVFFAGNDLTHSRLGITATRKLGGAVVRNRLKRWTRETYRRQRLALGLDPRHLDYVINVKPGAADASYLDYSVDLQRVLQRAGSDDAKSR